MRQGEHDTLSTSLLERVRGREPQAWERLVAIYLPLVSRWAKRSGLSDEDSLDVAQDVFAAVAQGLAGFRRETPDDSFRGWLRTITRHKIIDHVRKQARHPAAVGGTDAQGRIEQIAAEFDSVTSHVSPDETALLVRQALECVRTDFADATWQIFWRFAVDGIPAATLAQERGITEWAVYKARSRVLARLKNELAGLADEN
jgi:RNA polymerase sigma-70 factor (ECF subfamily)